MFWWSAITCSQRLCFLLGCSVSWRPTFHFQVQPAVVQSHFNTNCFRPHKCACALKLTPLRFSACTATLVAVDTKIPAALPTLNKKTKNSQTDTNLSTNPRPFPSAALASVIKKKTRRQLCLSFGCCVHWPLPAGLKSQKKKMSWCWRKVTSTRLSWLIPTSWLNSVSTPRC